MLKDGYTLMHEHIFIELSGIKKLDDCRLDCKNETIELYLKINLGLQLKTNDISNQ